MKRTHAILLAAGVVFVLYGYPGYMTTGAVDQLVDARVGSFTDWAPPLMTELWRIIGFVCSGPAGMLLLQGTLLLVGAYHLLGASMTRRSAAVCAACVLLTPPVLATLAVIWPQSQLVAMGIAGAAALGARTPRRRWLALPVLFVACGLGAGAALAMLPIIVARLEVRARPWLRLAVAVVAWAVLVTSAALVNHALVDRVTHREDIALAMNDLAGTLHAQVEAPTTDEQVEALLSAHRAAVLHHPGAYIAHRWTVAKRILGLHRTRAWRPMHKQFLGARSQRDAVQHTARHSPVQYGLVAAVFAVSRTFLFHPYVYAILAVLLLPIAIASRSRDAMALLVSGLVGEVGALVSATTPELRHSIWLIVTTLVATMVLVAQRQNRGTNASATTQS